MASGNSDAAAQMIGAQLQSLLKIPPIQKSDSTNPVETRNIGALQGPPYPPSTRSEEKENAGGSNATGCKSSDSSRNISPFQGSANEPRDRFGRPFQSIDRRGRPRERDFQTESRRFNNNPVQQDHTRSSNNFTPNRPGTGKRRLSLNMPAPMAESVEEAVVEQGVQELHVSPPAVSQTDRNNDEGTIGSKIGVGNPRARYSSPSGRIDQFEAEKLTIEQLIERPECPLDIKQNGKVMNENRLDNGLLLDILRSHGIYRLYPNYRRCTRYYNHKFFCEACGYHLESLKPAIIHILQERHFLAERVFALELTTGNCCYPTAEGISYFDELMMKTVKLEGLSDHERSQRQRVVDTINRGIALSRLDCKATLFGSTVGGYALRDSNVNINITVGSDSDENGVSSPRGVNNASEFAGITSRLVNIIKRLPHVKKDTVKEVYTTKGVSINFEEDSTRSKFIVHFNNASAVHCSELFAEYDKFDPRTRPLMLAFRLLGKALDIDDPDKGFLPPHSFPLMAIHYLQRRRILPVLNLLPHAPDKLFASAKDAKKMNAVVEDDDKASVGELWVEMMRYYGSSLCFRERLITMSRNIVSLNKEEKQWNRKINIEDPMNPKLNLSRTVTNLKLCEYIIEKLRIAGHYFRVPRNASGRLFDGIHYQDFFRQDIAETVIIPIYTDLSRAQEFLKEFKSESRNKGRIVPIEESKGNKNRVGIKVDMATLDHNGKNYRYIKDSDAVIFKYALRKHQMSYDFNPENFTEGSMPPIICKACGAEGHLKSQCPDETVPPFLPVTKPSKASLIRLKTAININYGREAIDARDITVRKAIREEMIELLLPLLPNVILTLFGSSLNGFGMHTSDVDLCFTLKNLIIPPGVGCLASVIDKEQGIRLVDKTDVLNKIETALKSANDIRDVVCIRSAKVPIVKFYHERHHADGDISLYNSLSICNTEMLKTYTELDERVAPLGLFLKKIVKICNIGEASKGSLSSYCYILMLIHFLQHHRPPVLPILQEFRIPKRRYANFFVDNHQVTYESDPNLVKEYWPLYGKNKESVSELWLEFLNYYVEKFDNEKYVITISQAKPLSRLEKCWHTEGLAIEDPFDKTHNLGGGLSRRMSVHILKTFQKCRTFFNQSIDNLDPDRPILQYYLNTDNIRAGSPPIDRQCRLCLRIGHYARNCSYKSEAELRSDSQQDASPPEEVRPSENESPPENVNNGSVAESVAKDEDESAAENSNTSSASTNNEPYGVSLSASDPAVVLCSKIPNGSAGVSGLFQSNIRLQDGDSDQNILSLFKNQHLIQPKEVAKDNVDPPKKRDFQPVKAEIVFISELSDSNSEEECIQAMLEKNEGVTFTFDINSKREQMESPEINVGTTLAKPEPVHQTMVRLPPPGFCPPGMIPPPPMTSTIHHAIPYITGQMHGHIVPIPQSQPPHSISFSLSAAQGIAYQPVMSGPFGSRPPPPRNMESNQNERQHGVGGAPPPGFAPLAAGNNSSVMPPPPQPQAPHEMVRGFPPPFTAVPGPNAIGGAQIGVNFPHMNGYSPAPSAPNTPNAGEQGGSVVYRSTETGEVPLPHQSGLNFEMIPITSGSPTVSNPIMIQPHAGGNMGQPQPIPGFPGRQDLMMNRRLANGHPDNSEEPSMIPQGPPPFIKPGGALPHEQAPGYNPEFGGGHGHVMSPGNPPVVVSYGLSLSQSHHAPVVSALQMQHSQHHPPHPMQGNHFHHPVRPYMALGNFPGNTYQYPPVHVPPLPPQQGPHSQQGLHPPHGPPPPQGPAPTGQHIHENAVPLQGCADVPSPPWK